MKWVAISGSWRHDLENLRSDVTRTVAKIIKRGDGIVVGGALGVDYLATKAALKIDPKAQKLLIILPAPLEIYLKHYNQRAAEGVITLKQLKMLSDQLKTVNQQNPKALKSLNHRLVNKRTYYLRNKAVVEAADEVIAFQVNRSLGTGHTISYGQKLGKPVSVNRYSVKS